MHSLALVSVVPVLVSKNLVEVQKKQLWSQKLSMTIFGQSHFTTKVISHQLTKIYFDFEGRLLALFVAGPFVAPSEG